MVSTTAPATGPLVGLRIVELEAIGPVPLAGMVLADMGCDVVRIRRPGPRAPSGSIVDRGRREVTLDLKHQAGRDAALSLVGHADALLEGARPGVMERLGLGPAPCLAANPRLVYGRMTGWGQTGPLAPFAGHDINYIALTGALHAIGTAQGTVPPLNLVGDYGGGAMVLALGVLAALLSARSSGQGQVVDAAMTDGSAVLMSLFYGFHAAGLWQDRRMANLLDGAAPFYRTYRCADGREVAVGAIEPQFYAALLAGLDLDPAAFPQRDRTCWAGTSKAFAERFATRARDEWAAIFDGTDACVTPVLSLAEAPHHPHNLARKTFDTVNGVPQPMPAPRFSETPGAARNSEAADVEAILSRWSAAG